MRKLLALLFSAALALAILPGHVSSAQTEGAPPISGDSPPDEPGIDERPPRAPGEGGSQAAPIKDHLRVSVLTFSPGDHPFYKFGHNAILIYDDSKRGKRDYAKVIHVKPPSSRKDSSELYVLATGFRGRQASPEAT